MDSLCLSCCSTLPSKTKPQYTTKCCNRHICDTCLTTNPRLSQYHPCLFCVGGVQVASGSKHLPPEYTSPRVEQKKQEANTFVIGDEDEDDADAVTKPSASEESRGEAIGGEIHSDPTQQAPEETPVSGPVSNSKYWIQKRDTIQGIALRFNVNARVLCQLNSLPPSTLSTTPHLLHTRSYLILPPGIGVPEAHSAEAEQREEERRRERAMKRFQSVTKVVDYDVAKTYMALAEDEHLRGASARDYQSGKEKGRIGDRSADEEAVDAYLEDEEWEREQLRLGSGVRIEPFPFFEQRRAAAKG